MTFDAKLFAERCARDPELRMAARFWTGGLRFVIGDTEAGFTTTAGAISPDVPSPGDGVITVTGPAETWEPLMAAKPAPFAQMAVISSLRDGGLDRSLSDETLWWQYLPAVERASELLRADGATHEPRRDEGSGPRTDSPVGGYLHLELDLPGAPAVDHRIYYETAGQGIPLLLQHTAGAHSVQWRHLFEMPEITDHFQLVAYDLPYHGKSIPPVDQTWWEDEYKLEGEFLRQIPVGVARGLGLDQPVFMGCSVGGLLAIDLALHHPDIFRSVISVEGGLRIGGDWESLVGLWHPQVSNQSKARLMEAMCAPNSPKAYVKEVSQVYSAGWPPAFLGDLWYYMVDYDLRERAAEIDTSTVGVHILNGEYDFSGTVKHGLTAHEAIAGSTHTVMTDMGHFPMQENPIAFGQYLAPILNQIRGV